MDENVPEGEAPTDASPTEQNPAPDPGEKKEEEQAGRRLSVAKDVDFFGENEEDLNESSDDPEDAELDLDHVEKMEEAEEGDHEALDFQLQQLLLGFYTIAADMGQSAAFTASGNSRLNAIAAKSDAENEKTKQIHVKAKAAGGRRGGVAEVKRDAGEALLNCIMKVVEMSKKSRVQELLQNFMIDFLSPPSDNAGLDAFGTEQNFRFKRQKKEEFWEIYRRTDLTKCFRAGEDIDKTVPLIGGVVPRSKSERTLTKDSAVSGLSAVSEAAYTVGDCESEIYYDGAKFRSSMKNWVKTFKQQQELKKQRKLEGIPLGMTRSMSLPAPGTSQSQRMRDVASQEPSRDSSKQRSRWQGSANSGNRVTSNTLVSTPNNGRRASFEDESLEYIDSKDEGRKNSKRMVQNYTAKTEFEYDPDYCPNLEPVVHKPSGDHNLILRALGLDDQFVEMPESDESESEWMMKTITEEELEEEAEEEERIIKDTYGMIPPCKCFVDQFPRTKRRLNGIPEQKVPLGLPSQPFENKLTRAEIVSKRPLVTYLRSCASKGILPKPMIALLDSEKGKYGVEFNPGQISDNDMDSFNKALKPLKITRLNMPGNDLKESLLKLFVGLRCTGGSSLEEINFAGSRLDTRGIYELSKSLGNLKFPKLRLLNLEGVPLNETSSKSLYTGLGKVGSLHNLNLANTMIGAVSQAAVINIANMTAEHPGLKILNLSHNFIQQEGFIALGHALRETGTLQELYIDYNAGGNHDYHAMTALNSDKYYPPTLGMMEGLSKNTTILTLSLQGSYGDYQTDFALCESLDQHPSLNILDLSYNPHGVDGLRCLLRLVLNVQCNIQKCLVTRLRERHEVCGGSFRFCFSEPNGEYKLNLYNPADRACLRLLCKYATHAKVPFDKAFNNQEYNGKKCAVFPCVPKGSPPVYEVELSEGFFSFNFNLELPDAAEDCSKHLETMKKFSKQQASLIRFVALSNMYSSLVIADERRIMILAMSHDLIFKECHVKWFIKQSHDMVPFIVRNLYATLEPEEAMKLVDLVPIAYRAVVRKQTKNAFFFNPLNPTDRYALDLTSPSDRSVAERILTINTWEKQMAMKKDLVDKSEHGTFDCLRNCKLNKLEFIFDSKFRIPPDGMWYFDYVTLVPIGKDKKATDDDLLVRLMERMASSPSKDEVKILALRAISHFFNLTRFQIERMTSYFKADCDRLTATVYMDFRVEVFILTYGGSINRREMMMIPKTNCNQKNCKLGGLLYNPKIFTATQTSQIRTRLGRMNTFDPLHVCCKNANGGNHFTLNLTVYEHRQIAKFLIILAAVEDGENMLNTNWSECGFSNREGGGVFMVPATWLPEPPDIGTFYVTYVSEKPEYILLKKREELAIKLLGWLNKK